MLAQLWLTQNTASTCVDAPVVHTDHGKRRCWRGFDLQGTQQAQLLVEEQAHSRRQIQTFGKLKILNMGEDESKRVTVFAKNTRRVFSEENELD
jgi:hypothetical protein